MSGTVRAGSYRDVLLLPSALRTFVPALVGRLSYGLLPLSLLFTVQQSTDSFATAGAAVAVFGLASLSMPYKARLVDRFSQRRILPLLAVGCSAALVVLAFATSNAHLGGRGGTARAPAGTVDAVQLATAHRRVVAERTGLCPGRGLRGIASSSAVRCSPAPDQHRVRPRGPRLHRGSDGRRHLRHGHQPGDQAHDRRLRRPATRWGRSSFPGCGGSCWSSWSRRQGSASPTSASPVSPSARGAQARPGTSRPASDSAASSVDSSGLVASHTRSWQTHLAGLIGVLAVGLLAASLVNNLIVLGVVMAATGVAVAPLFVVSYLAADDVTPPHQRTEASTWINTANNLGSVGRLGARRASLIHRTTPSHGFLAAGLLLAASIVGIVRRPTGGRWWLRLGGRSGPGLRGGRRR